MDDIEAFDQRVFSGRDLFVIMDSVGVGTGSTIHVVQEIELEQIRPITTYRQWTFPKELTVDRILAWLSLND